MGKAALSHFTMFKQSFSGLYSILHKELALPDLPQHQAV